VNSGQYRSATERLYVAWHRCVLDGRDHAVTDEEFARGRKEHTQGRYESVCGHVVLIGSMLLPPGPVCARCHAYLVARATLRSAEQRLGPTRHRKPSRWGRLFGRTQIPVVPLPRTSPDVAPSPERDGRTPIPAGAGSAPSAPVPAGHHALRGAR
jgi:hypothetical protein